MSIEFEYDGVEIGAAYFCLTDSQKRAQYDARGPDAINQPSYSNTNNFDGADFQYVMTSSCGGDDTGMRMNTTRMSYFRRCFSVYQVCCYLLLRSQYSAAGAWRCLRASISRTSSASSYTRQTREYSTKWLRF